MDIKQSKFKYSPQHVGRGLSVQRLGGVCLMNLCGIGETLFSQYTIDLTTELLKQGHFIIIVTNGCAQFDSYEQLTKLPEEYRRRLLVKFSFHYLELMRLDLFDTYWKHVHLLRNAGIGISIEFCPSDEAMPFKDKIKQMCLDQVGALPHVTNARQTTNNDLKLLTKMSVAEYKKFWSDFDSDMFDVKIDSYYNKPDCFCYAGDWSVYLNAGTGIMHQCHFGEILSDDIFEDIDKPIPFKPIGKCKAPYCVNAHCGLSMGCLPDINVKNFCDTRDKICNDGTHWLSDEWIKFSSQKLYDNNPRLPEKQEKKIMKTKPKVSHPKHQHSFWWHVRHMKF